VPRRIPRRSPFLPILAIGLPLVAGAAWLVNRPPAPLPTAHAELVVEVEGLDCAVWCPIGVDAAFAGVAGSQVLRIDVVHGVLTVAFDERRVGARELLRRIDAKWPIRSATRIERPSGRVTPLTLDAIRHS